MTHPDISDWRVRIGAHKTASSHLGRLLLEQKDRLAEHGVSHVSQRDVIRPMLRNLSLLERVAMKASPVSARLVALRRGRRMRDEILGHVDRSGTVLISEENLIGSMKSCLSGRLYPDLSRIELLRGICGSDPIRLFLSIRSLDSHLPSLYCQEIKVSNLDRAVLNRAAAAYVARPPRWIDLIRRIRSILPGAELKIWDYADYRANDWRIAEAVSGVGLGPVTLSNPPKKTMSPSAAAVTAVEALNLPKGPERSKRVKEIFEADKAEGAQRERFDPLTIEAKQVLRDAFHRDLDDIDRAFPGMRLTFAG